MQNFDAALNVFIDQCQIISDVYMERTFPTLDRPVISAGGGQKFIRVVRTETGQGESGHCFVAKTDGSNKKLGSWRAGDVFKCDGWKGPARGARGNIFDNNHGIARMGPYGPAYN